MKFGLLDDRVTELEKRPILVEEVEEVKKSIAPIKVKVDALERKQPLLDDRMDEFDDWKQEPNERLEILEAKEP